MTGMEHAITVRRNNSKLGNLSLLPFWAWQLCSQKSRSAVHAVWLVVLAGFLFWFGFFFTLIPCKHRTQTIDCSTVGCTGVQQSLSYGSEPLYKASGCSVWDPCVASVPGRARAAATCWNRGVAGVLFGKGQLHFSSQFSSLLLIIQELKGIWVLLLK